MQQLLNSLADLSGLRDRDELDFALVQALRANILGGHGAVRLVRAIGQAHDQHWLVRAQTLSSFEPPTRDVVWSDWSHLPKMAAYPKRQQTVSSGEIVSTLGNPCTTIFPIDAHPSVCSLLEMESDHALSEQVLAMTLTMLRLYKNLLGLLDYGEKDALTDLLNRKSFDGAFVRAAVEPEVNPAYEKTNRRNTNADAGGNFWLVMLDIDHFKRVNDTYGHLIGDEVLLLLARLMRATFRLQDQLYRFGGEEFVVLLRCFDHTDISNVLERLRRAVEEFSFPQVERITVSVGFTKLRPDDTPDVAFGRSDRAVYYAKAHGRNQVCSYSELVESGALAEHIENTTEVSFF
jgi:diguanylate cyclase (GGDEF)-like protein